jgi:hypothetical protein
MRIWLLSGLAALALAGPAFAQETAVETVGVALPVQPDVEGIAVEIDLPPPAITYGECIPSLIPAGGRCYVVGSSVMPVGVNWALYEIRAAGKRSGLSVLMAPDAAGDVRVADTVSLPADALDRWKREPYVMASILKRDDAEYAVVMAPGDEGPAAFSVARLGPAGWTKLDTSGLWPAIAPKLTSLTSAQCYPITTDMSWRAFALRYGMLSDEGNCGTVILSLGVENGALKITEAMAVRPDVTPSRRSRGRRR